MLGLGVLEEGVSVNSECLASELGLDVGEEVAGAADAEGVDEVVEDGEGFILELRGSLLVLGPQ